jgi:hypothetical protein
MKKELCLRVLALMLGAWLSGCSATSPARLCDSPLVPVNVLAPSGHSAVSHAGTDHE